MYYRSEYKQCLTDLFVDVTRILSFLLHQHINLLSILLPQVKNKPQVKNNIVEFCFLLVVSSATKLKIKFNFCETKSFLNERPELRMGRLDQARTRPEPENTNPKPARAPN